MFILIKNIITIASSKLALLLLNVNQFIFLCYSIFTNNNTPPMPLYDAHLGGFLFL
jgi:hypothetical protein